ncbi:hypothetical protein ACP4OV_015044 [Aristida adscensionis]
MACGECGCACSGAGGEAPRGEEESLEAPLLDPEVGGAVAPPPPAAGTMTTGSSGSQDAAAVTLVRLRRCIVRGDYWPSCGSFWPIYAEDLGPPNPKYSLLLHRSFLFFLQL